MKKEFVKSFQRFCGCYIIAGEHLDELIRIDGVNLKKKSRHIILLKLETLTSL